jgi:hypothetical protein
VAYQLMEYMLAQTTPREITRQGKAIIYSFDILLHSRKWPGVLHIAWTPGPGDREDVVLPMICGGPTYVFDYLGAEQQAVSVDVPAVAAGPNPEDRTTSGTSALQKGDVPTTRTCRFSVTHEPLYIWDSGATLKPPPPPARTSR